MNAQPRVAARPAEERAANHGSSDRGKPAGAPLTQDAWRVYKRLLGYARPHLGMFMIGVVGMLLNGGLSLTGTIMSAVTLKYEPRQRYAIVGLGLGLIGLFIGAGVLVWRFLFWTGVLNG